jgi:hypothetical protein
MSETQSGAAILVRRDDLRQARLEHFDLPLAPQPGEILCRVERFALTANNITYGVFGDQIGYWRFFPAEAPWGRIPVWGHARVLASGHPQIGAGERLFGYMPMSSHARFTVGRLDADSLIDAAPHRAELPPTYNRYLRLPAGAGDRRGEDLYALFRPLFMLSFLVTDFLGEQQLFGARRAILSSASSKTALGLAQILAADRPGGIEVIGLTSPRNAAFVRATGYYDQVVDYAAIDQLPLQPGAVFIDMAGNAETLAAVHHRLGDQLKHSCLVGATHWDQRAAAATALPGPRPQFFFAPDRIRQRVHDWGRAEFDRRYNGQLQRFLGSIEPWFRLREVDGGEPALAAYRRLLAGDTDPAEGCLLSL